MNKLRDEASKCKENCKDNLQACISLNIFEVRFILHYDNIFEINVDSIEHPDENGNQFEF